MKESILSKAGLLVLCLTLACDGSLNGNLENRDTVADASEATCVPETDAGTPEPIPEDPISHSRLLRRVALVLHGRPPLDEERAALDAATTDEERDAVIQAAIDSGLASTDFYERMVDFGHHWMRNGAFVDGGWGNMSTHLGRCPADTAHPGAYYIAAESASRGRADCGNAEARTRDIEPWWAPGTTVTLVGDAVSEAQTVVDSGGRTRDCGIAEEGYYNLLNAAGCGCGPHAVWCYPGVGLGLGSDGRGSLRRDMWDEPARLVAHVAWHDRPLSDVVLGNYTVGTNRVHAWYLRFGRQTGIYPHLDDDVTWFRPEVGDSPRDPLHPDPTDVEAWRELVTERLAPQLLSLSGGSRSADLGRTLRWDPRTDEGEAPGLPMAGVLTMPSPNLSFPRERPRASRFLEIFTCREFNPPPPEAHFPPVGDDLATSGTCMHCHVLMDPVAMAFRRWIFMGNYTARPYLADLGNLRVPADLFEPARRHPYSNWFGAGADRWAQNWLPNTTMTPVAPEELAANPRLLFFDTIPTSYSVLGQHPDGTMGPLGFAKVLVTSGEFDRCAVRRLYARVMGRELDPTREARYIDTLAREFADSGRLVRPLVARLLRSSELRRGL